MACGLWVGGLVLWGNLAQSAYPPLGGGRVWVGWVGGSASSFVHENTIFTERMVVKSGKNFRFVGSGL